MDVHYRTYYNCLKQTQLYTIYTTVRGLPALPRWDVQENSEWGENVEASGKSQLGVLTACFSTPVNLGFKKGELH